MTLEEKHRQLTEEMEKASSRLDELMEQRNEVASQIQKDKAVEIDPENVSLLEHPKAAVASDTFTTADVLQQGREAVPKCQARQDARARGSLLTAEFIRNGLREAAQKIREEGLGKEALQKAIRKKSEEVLQEAMSATPVVPPPYMQNLPIRKKDLTDPLSRKQTRLDLTLQLLKKVMDPDEMGVEDVKWLVRAMQGLQWSRDAGLAVVEGIETAEQSMQMENCDESIAENGTGRGTPAASSRTGNFQRGGTVPGAGCDLVPDVLPRGSAEVEGRGQQSVRRSGAAGGDGAGCSGEEHF